MSVNLQQRINVTRTLCVTTLKTVTSAHAMTTSLTTHQILRSPDACVLVSFYFYHFHIFINLMTILDIALRIDNPSQHVPVNEPIPHTKGMPCGRNNFCNIDLGEVCVGGTRCTCRPNEGRSDNSKRCQQLDETPLTFRVVSRGQQPLFYRQVFNIDLVESLIN